MKSEHVGLEITNPKNKHYSSKRKTDYVDGSEMEQTEKNFGTFLVLKMDAILHNYFLKVM